MPTDRKTIEGSKDNIAISASVINEFVYLCVSGLEEYRNTVTLRQSKHSDTRGIYIRER